MNSTNGANSHGLKSCLIFSLLIYYSIFAKYSKSTFLSCTKFLAVYMPKWMRSDKLGPIQLIDGPL